MSEITELISILALVAVVGLWIGHWQVYGVSLGIGGVLFGGIAIGHIIGLYGIQLTANMSHMLHFIQEFGLILFIYSIGIQVGPGFFSSLRRSGLRLNLFAFLIVLIGSLVAACLYKVFNISLPVILGILSGATTNTPSLAAGQQILNDLKPDTTDIMGMAYAMAYPFGICGILLSMWLIRVLFNINVKQESVLFETDLGITQNALLSINIEVTNPNLIGVAIQDIPMLNNNDGIICSRLKRNGELMVPSSEMKIQLGDYLHLVGQKKQLDCAKLIIGQEINTSLTTRGSSLNVVRVVVTNDKVLGKKLAAITHLQQNDVVISRLNRAGIELIPNRTITLHFGDILNLVGKKEAIEAAIDIVGNAQQKLQQVQMLPVFIGIGLGVLLGSVPIVIPGFPAPLKLGLAGGPLIIALILGRIGCIGKLYWFMPPSANLAVRELGIVLFLSVVGLNSGSSFINTLVEGNGIAWMGYGILITLIPLLIVGIIARMFGKINYLTLCGILAGSMTDPPALAFANNINPNSGASALSYAAVYPLAMFLRIISPQLLVLIFWV